MTGILMQNEAPATMLFPLSVLYTFQYRGAKAVRVLAPVIKT